MNQIAQLNFAPKGGFTGFGPLGTPTDNGIGTFAGFVSSAIGLMTIIAAIWFVFTFMTGAVGIVASGGDKNALESSKKKITTGLIGLVVVVSAIFVIKLFGALIGLPDILSIQNMFSRIQIGN